MPRTDSPHRLSSDRSAILVIDLQEKLAAAIESTDHVVQITTGLLESARLLGVPFAATVQYPKGLGGLVPPLCDWFPRPEEKLDFSSAVCRRELDPWIRDGRDQILLCGIETHICVLQTALELKAEGLSPVIVAEAVASRGGWEHELAIEQLTALGIPSVSFESVVFQWLQSAEHPQFKAVSRIVKSLAESR
jgi:nicotinamidase-related amidase